MAVIIFLFNCIVFWFIEAPIGLIKYFNSLNTAFLRLFSFPILIRTFFKPLKNEYRQGYVELAVLLGIIIKIFIIVIDLLLLIVLLFIEIIFVLAFILWPLAAIGIFIKKI